MTESMSRAQRGLITRVLWVVMSMIITQGLAAAQALSTPPQASSLTSITVDPGHGSNQEAIRPCTLRAPDTAAQSSANMKQTTGLVSFTYIPLSAHCKFHVFLQSTYSPYTFASAGFQATWAQAMGQWPHYGGGAQGWAKRLGATLADTESRRFIQTFALSTILHQDPRYFPSHKRAFVSRAWYSATRVVVTKDDSGHNAFNTSEFLGALFTSALQNSYYPRHDRTFGDTMNRFGGSLSSDALGNLLREFTPDMKRLFRRHAPKEIREIEEKLPIPPEDKL